MPTRLVTGLSIFLLAAYSDSDVRPKLIPVLAYDVCVVDLPVRSLTMAYGDDAATGSVIYSDYGSKQVSIDFYIGNHPDTDSFIERSLIHTGNPDVVSAARQRYADGSYVVELKLKESAFHQDTVALRSTDKPSEEQELLAVAERIRRCRIR